MLFLLSHSHRHKSFRHRLTPTAAFLVVPSIADHSTPVWRDDPTGTRRFPPCVIIHRNVTRPRRRKRPIDTSRCFRCHEGYCDVTRSSKVTARKGHSTKLFKVHRRRPVAIATAAPLSRTRFAFINDDDNGQHPPISETLRIAQPSIGP